MQMSTPKRHEHHLGFALLQSKHLLLSVLVRRRGKRTSLSRSSIFSPARRAAPCARVVTTYESGFEVLGNPRVRSAPPQPSGEGGTGRNDGNFVLTSNFSIGEVALVSLDHKKENENETSQDEAQKRLRRGGKDRRIKQSPRRCRPSVRVL